MSTLDIEYHLLRAQESREVASRSRDPAAWAAYEEMAREYERRAGHDAAMVPTAAPLHQNRL